MIEWFSAAVPLIGLVLFLALVYWPEVRPALHRLSVAHVGTFPAVSPRRSAPVIPVRRRVRRSMTAKRAVLRERAKRHVQGIEQPRTTQGDRFAETQRIDIAKRLLAAGIAETVIIECVWQVRRGGGKSFLAAREEFRTDVIDDTVAVDVAA